MKKEGGLIVRFDPADKISVAGEIIRLSDSGATALNTALGLKKDGNPAALEQLNEMELSYMDPTGNATRTLTTPYKNIKVVEIFKALPVG